MSMISIHALREESDESGVCVMDTTKEISIHALREESDQVTAVVDSITESFQSTLSVRRATEADDVHREPADISIHALREESDFGA